jgi:hypothetical protein
MRMGTFQARFLCLLVTCLILAGSGCRQFNAGGNASLKTPPKGLPVMKRVGGSGAGGNYSPAELF